MLASINASYILICNAKCVKIVLRFKRKYNGLMVNKNKQTVSNVSSMAYIWTVPLVVLAAIFWWLGNGFSPLFILWAIVAYCSVRIIRGDKLSLLVLALLYALAYVVSDVIRGISSIFWNVYGNESPAAFLWQQLSIESLLLFAFIAYFSYRRRTVRSVVFGQRAFEKVFLAAASLVVGYNLVMTVISQAASSTIMGAGLLPTLLAVVSMLFGMKRHSWVGVSLSIIFFSVAIGFAVQDVIWDPQAGRSLGVISILGSFVGIVLAYWVSLKVSNKKTK